MIASQSSDPQAAFHRELHDPGVLDLIFRNSAAYRERLKRYMLREMQLEEGDTVVLADTGYTGVTQDYLTRAFGEDLNIEILGRYVLNSHEPDRPATSKALITTTWCDHSLFEQSCTFREGAVVDYDAEGQPVFEDVRLSDAQYDKVAEIQEESLRFVRDAKAFFEKAGFAHDLSVLQGAAHAALFRHVYMPLAAELEYFQGFQHDKDMGPDRKKTVYDVPKALSRVRASPSHRLDAYETRGLGLDFTFSALMQRVFRLDLTPEDMHLRSSPLAVGAGEGQHAQVFSLDAPYRHDGYFSIVLPCASGVSLTLFLGRDYEWLQMDEVRLVDQWGNPCADAPIPLELNGIDRNGEIHRCLSEQSAATIRAVVLRQDIGPVFYRIVFRPLVPRAKPQPTLMTAS